MLTAGKGRLQRLSIGSGGGGLIKLLEQGCGIVGFFVLFCFFKDPTSNGGSGLGKALCRSGEHRIKGDWWFIEQAGWKALGEAAEGLCVACCQLLFGTSPNLGWNGHSYRGDQGYNRSKHVR